MRRRTSFNAIHKEALVNVDFSVRRAEVFSVEEFGRRRRVTLDGHEMWMVSPEDLIPPKLVWGQTSRWDVETRDVRAVIAVQAADLDWTYLTRWADALGVSDALRQARGMSDTIPDMEATFAAMLATLSPTERVRTMSERFDTARHTLISNVRANQPGISDAELRVQVFVRTYHDDYTPAERDRIVAFIRQQG